MKDNMSTESIVGLIVNRQAALGLSDEEVATALGYTNGRVVEMMKAGTMNVPVNKVAALARVLQVEEIGVLRLVLIQAGPEIWRAISEVIAPLGPLSTTEINLIRHVRRLSAGHELKPIVFDGKGVVALVALE